ECAEACVSAYVTSGMSAPNNEIAPWQAWHLARRTAATSQRRPELSPPVTFPPEPPAFPPAPVPELDVPAPPRPAPLEADPPAPVPKEAPEPVGSAPEHPTASGSKRPIATMDSLMARPSKDESSRRAISKQAPTDPDDDRLWTRRVPKVELPNDRAF